MVFEMRTYEIQPAAMSDYLDLYALKGRAVQQRHLGEMVGFFQTELGPLNQAVSLWRHDSLDERLRRRSALAADPEWQDYVRAVRPLFVAQDSKILLAAPFSPLR